MRDDDERRGERAARRMARRPYSRSLINRPCPKDQPPLPIGQLCQPITALSFTPFRSAHTLLSNIENDILTKILIKKIIIQKVDF